MSRGPRYTSEKAAFLAKRNAYRERFKRDGTALTPSEAAAAYKLVAPLCNQSLVPDIAEYRAVVARCSSYDSDTGRLCLDVETITAMLTAFEAEHDSAPAPEILAEPWERYYGLKCLQLLVGEDLVSYPPAPIRELIARAVPILERERPVTRPRGRYNAAIREGRDLFIVEYLAALEGCGLPVTARNRRPSLARAMADALNMRERVIRGVWGAEPTRTRQFNDLLPAALRWPESMLKRSRNIDPELSAYALDVPCARCGNAGKVPKYRVQEGGSRLCTNCREW